MIREYILGQKIPGKDSTSDAAVIQPTPKGEGQPIYEMVIDDIKERAEIGRETYGEPLKANNGRKPLVDMYQEMLDGVQYLKQHLVEQEETMASQMVRQLKGMGKDVFVSGIGSEKGGIGLTLTYKETCDRGVDTIIEFHFEHDCNRLSDIKVYSGIDSHKRSL